METTYKGHRIQVFSHLKPDSHRWTVETHVLQPEINKELSRRFQGPLEGFASRTEAESWGIQTGKKWIDAGKPDLTE